MDHQRKSPALAGNPGSLETLNGTQDISASALVPSTTNPFGKRKPPAYLCYASDFTAEVEYMEASAAERGLLFSLLNFCWTNGSIPANRAKWPKYLALDAEDVSRGDGALVRKHLVQHPEDPTSLHNEEISRQRARLAEIRRAQSDAGKRTAALRWGEPQAGDSSAISSAPNPANSSGIAPEKKRTEKTRTDVTEENGIRKWLQGYGN